MGPNKVIILASLLIVAVSAICNLRSDLQQLRYKIAQCDSNISPYYAFDMLKQMADDTLTFERFVERLHPFCEKTPQKLSCLFENVTIREDCKENKEIQNILNMQTMLWYGAKFLCENNATRYLDLAVGDGPLCYANSDLHRHCTEQPKYDQIVFNRTPVSNANLCSLLGVTDDCLSSYDHCENQNVRLHIGNMNEQIQSEFGCLN